MTFLGKEYKFVSQENFEAYANGIGLPESDAKGYVNYHPTLKLEKNGDTYTLYFIDAQLKREIKFKVGEEVVENGEKYTTTSTFTVDGNMVKKVQQVPGGNILTHKYEFSGDSLVETYTASKWDGEAKRFYKA